MELLKKIKALFRRKGKVVEEKLARVAEAASEEKTSEPETAESIGKKQRLNCIIVLKKVTKY